MGQTPSLRALRRNQPANILISDFQPPELWDNKCLLFKSPHWWHFAMAALETSTQRGNTANAWNLKVWGTLDKEIRKKTKHCPFPEGEDNPPQWYPSHGAGTGKSRFYSSPHLILSSAKTLVINPVPWTMILKLRENLTFSKVMLPISGASD